MLARVDNREAYENIADSGYISATWLLAAVDQLLNLVCR